MDDFEKLINASDLVEWIMETYPDWCVGDVRSIVDHIEDLPSAQTDIVRCKDCRYYQDNNNGYPHMNCKWDANETPDADDFCSGAERRTDEQSN